MGKHHGKLVALVFVLTFALVSCAAPATEMPVLPAETKPADGDGVIVLGDISDDPTEVIEGSQPLASYLAGKLADYGISKGQVKIAPSMDAMVEMLKNIDL